MTTDIDTRVCCGGMICEEHPGRAWPDGDPDCSGPGMPCLHPSARDAALRQAGEALRKYGKHDDGRHTYGVHACGAGINPTAWPCTCGLADAIEALEVQP